MPHIRKHPIRGRLERTDRFFVRLTVQDNAGRKAIQWPHHGIHPTEARAEFRKLLVERSENRVRHIGHPPKFGDYLKQTSLPALTHSGKKPDTLVTEKGHLARWAESIGHRSVGGARW